MRQLKKETSVISIRSPISGYVEKLSVKVGDAIKEANLVAMIIDRDNVVVEYLLPGKYSVAAKLGQKVIVKRITGSEKETTMGTVTKVDRSGTRYVRDLHVTASLSKPKIPLQAGLIVSVTQILGDDVKALVIPATSIVSTKSGTKVFTIKNGRAKLVPITTGIHTENEVQVVEGLMPDALVITQRSKDIKNGTLIVLPTPEWKVIGSRHFSQ